LNLILTAVLLGALGGVLCSFTFFSKKKPKVIMKDNNNMDPSDSENGQKMNPTLLDRWFFRLAMLGFAMGVFAALGQGYLNIGFMIGFGLPFALVLGLIGSVIDFFRNK
jgi:hypothetical protein